MLKQRLQAKLILSMHSKKTRVGQTNSVHALFCKKNKRGTSIHTACVPLTLNVYFTLKKFCLVDVVVAVVAVVVGFC